MRSQCVIWLLLPGFAYVSGSPCTNTTQVSICYQNLLNYERHNFPFYGEDEFALDVTCFDIEFSVQCIRSYHRRCYSSPDCNDECRAISFESKTYLTRPGLKTFAEKLCAENSSLRKQYLKNAHCLKSITNEFATCHEDSQKSRSYLKSISLSEDKEAACCFSSWYEQCFTNATRESCGLGAARFVSRATRMLLVDWRIRHICWEPKVCHEPPMPTEVDVDGEIRHENEGVAHVSGSTCSNTTEAKICYKDLVYYESLAFPFYGDYELSLDVTCQHMVSSFQCIRSYHKTCDSSPDCGEECEDVRKTIGFFLSNTGLERFTGALCSENAPLKQTYLENIDCLQSKRDVFADCQNDSQKSLHYLNSDYRRRTKEFICCYFSWYKQCFMNATRDSCPNATEFMSRATQMLLVDPLRSRCEIVEPCHEPPMPTESPTE